MHAHDTRQTRDHRAVNAFKIRRIRIDDTQKIISAAGDEIALKNFRMRGHRSFKVIETVAPLLVERYRDKGRAG